MFSPIFVADAKTICGYNFVASLRPETIGLKKYSKLEKQTQIDY